MKQELKEILLQDIYCGRNVRIPGLAHESELYEDIKMNGLKTPPTVFPVNKVYEVIKGHLRIGALDRLQEEEPARFLELFPDGKIQVLVLSDISYEIAQLEKLDHGQENPLLHPMEVQLSMNLLFDAGKTEIQIATQLSGLMQRVSPMKADTRKVVDSLKKDIDLYREKGDLEAVKEKERQLAETLLAYHKGKIQNAKAIWRCPHIVMATMWFKATGGKRNWKGQIDADIGDDIYLPSTLQVEQCKKLAVAFDKDLQIKEANGICRYNKRVPGPNFNALWEDICSKSVEKESTEPKIREKAFSKDELKTDEVKWLSAGFKLLSQHHRREPGVDPVLLAQLDKTAYFAELMAERAPNEWAEAVKLAEGLEKLAVAEQKEVEAKEAAAAKDPTLTPPKEAAKAKAEVAAPKEEPAKIIKKGAGKSKK